MIIKTRLFQLKLNGVSQMELKNSAHQYIWLLSKYNTRRKNKRDMIKPRLAELWMQDVSKFDIYRLF